MLTYAGGSTEYFRVRAYQYQQEIKKLKALLAAAAQSGAQVCVCVGTDVQ